MKRILINATQNEEIRVALCKGNHLYDFDLENRTREQKKSNIYKGHVTRVEPSLEAVFVEYGSQRQGFLPIREISAEYLSGNPRDENIKKLIKEGDELIVQVEKEERGNKGAALSTYVSLAGRYLVLMPNNPRGGGISRQISGKLREDMKRMLSNLDLPKGMSVIIRTAGIGKTQEDLQHDLNHLLNIWQAIQEQNEKYPSPRLVHQEAGVVTRAVRDYLRDDIAEIWIDNENAYVEAAGFIDAVMPTQADKLRKYTDYEPMFARFNIEKQIETAYQREVRLPSGGSIVIDQTEALVSIDINSAKSTKGSDVAETAYHTNLEAADEIARQLRLRDMGGLIVIDFIDMNDNKHQKEVEKRLVDATKYDRARVQFGDISKFGLMEMSRQRLRPSLEESTGYICPRCHGNGMIRDLRSLSLSIMREIEQIALKERQGEVQAEVPTDIAAFLLNEKRDSIVYLEQDSGTRITILPHAHLESPNFKLHFNRDGFAPSSYERISDTQQQEHSGLGYEVDWQTAEKERPEQQPTRQPRKAPNHSQNHSADSNAQNDGTQSTSGASNTSRNNHEPVKSTRAVQNATQNNAAQGAAGQTTAPQSAPIQNTATQYNTAQVNPQNVQPAPVAAQVTAAQPQAVAWLSNLFAQAPQAQITASVSSHDAAEAIEALVNNGAQSLGSFGQVNNDVLTTAQAATVSPSHQIANRESEPSRNSQTARAQNGNATDDNTANNINHANADSDTSADERRRRKQRKSRAAKPHQRRESRDETATNDERHTDNKSANVNVAVSIIDTDTDDSRTTDNKHDKRSQDNTRGRNNQRPNSARQNDESRDTADEEVQAATEQTRSKRKPHSQRSSRGKLERGETLTADRNNKQSSQHTSSQASTNGKDAGLRHQNPNEVSLHVNVASPKHKAPEVVHLSLDDSKSAKVAAMSVDKPVDETPVQRDLPKADSVAPIPTTQASAAQPAVTAENVVEEKVQATVAAETIVPVVSENVQAETSALVTDESMTASTLSENTGDSQDDTAHDTTENNQSIVDAALANEKVDETIIKADDQAIQQETQQTSQHVTPQAEQQAVEPAQVVAAPTTTPVTQAVSGEVVTSKTSKATDSDSKPDVAHAAKDITANKSPALLELTHAALFGKRYVTANKFGQASNDPRVVRQQVQSKDTLTAPTAQVKAEQPVAAPVIRGTVGDFIQSMLPDAQTRLLNDGVIRSFIEAISMHNQQAQRTAVEVLPSSNQAQPSRSETIFDFSNYGYQPLAADYLSRFEAMTQAVSQFAAAQGKTAVEPRPITQRASNDPRGQHPDYQVQAVTLPIEAIEEPTEPTAQTDSALADITITESELDVSNIAADALVSESQADDVTEQSAQLLQAEPLRAPEHAPADTQPSATEVEAEAQTEAAMESVKDDSQANKSKTTIASYKNMIENVAEQLLPQMGMFNLTTPKVPKARSRKPKAEHKKPAQVDKVEPENTDSSNRDANNIDANTMDNSND
ncbi:Rne/Rng family ribonuclease [Psychrobacter sp. 16-MNA-CIBAN-0192]|uniref:Rne/Rng family ribonuclease n=1 Tax=Psychrobacter sp. 16-MNA-CIBAN-0192 TaxID=3140448 RepID=UPI003318E78D